MSQLHRKNERKAHRYGHGELRLRREAPQQFLAKFNNTSLAQRLGFYPMTLIYSGVGFAAAVWFNSRCNSISWRNSSMLGCLADCDGTCTLGP
jgi:hypothetical protein